MSLVGEGAHHLAAWAYRHQGRYCPVCSRAAHGLPRPAGHHGLGTGLGRPGEEMVLARPAWEGHGLVAGGPGSLGTRLAARRSQPGGAKYRLRGKDART